MLGFYHCKRKTRQIIAASETLRLCPLWITNTPYEVVLAVDWHSVAARQFLMSNRRHYLWACLPLDLPSALIGGNERSPPNSPK